MQTTCNELPPAEAFDESLVAPTIEPLSPRTECHWHAYVRAHSRTTLFHELSYRDAVQRAYAHVPVYLLARRAERICGVLPMFIIESRFAGRMLVSMPYAIYGGPLADDAVALKALRSAAEHEAAKRCASVIEWRTASQNESGTPPAWRSIDSYVTFIRELPTDPARLPEWLPRKARAAARRAAERNELTVSWDDADLDLVWTLYSRSMRRLGSINYRRELFRALADETPGAHLVQLIRCMNRPVAGLLTLIHRQVAMPYFVGLDERADIYGLSNFLYFKAMEKAVELGCRSFDFGRSRTDNPGSFDFKRFHGFNPHPLAYERFVPSGQIDPQLTPSNPRFALARRIWPRLPLSVTRPLGAWLSRSIPG